MFLFPKWFVLKLCSRPCSYGHKLLGLRLAHLVLFKETLEPRHPATLLWGGGCCFELQGLYSENINAGYWPDGNMLVTVLVTVEKLLPLVFPVGWAMQLCFLLITTRNGRFGFVLLSVCTSVYG